MYTVFIIFLWVLFVVIFTIDEKPINKSYLKAFVVLVCVFLTAHWWRINISINNVQYQEGCLISENRRRAIRYAFKNNDEVVSYIWSQPNEFNFKNEYLDKCFVVEYYWFIWDRYIYSATLIKGDE